MYLAAILLLICSREKYAYMLGMRKGFGRSSGTSARPYIFIPPFLPEKTKIRPTDHV